MGNINWTDDLDSYIKDNYQNIRAEDISINLNIPVSKIRGRISTLKLIKLKRQRLNVKYTYNYTFMDNLNKDNCYFLGLLWADGWIEKRTDYSYTVGLELTDYYIMHKLSILLNKTLEKRKPRKQVSKVYNIQGAKDVYVIRINGIHFANKLMDLGFTGKKKERDYMPNIPEKYYIDFIRGYFDGDGYISKSITKKCNKYQYMAGITNQHLNLLNVIKNYLGYGHIYDKGNIYSILFFKKEIIKLHNLIYQDTDLFMSRKKKLMMECMEDKDVY